MTPAVTISQRDGATILTLEGSATATLFSTLQADVIPACASQPVVLDITALTIAGSDGFRQLTGFLHWSSQTLTHVALVCRRLSARRLLHRSGAADLVPVFMSVDEAVSAMLVQHPAPVPAPGLAAAAGELVTRSGRSLAKRAARAKAPATPRYASPMGGEA
jgi:anti-anti-sigma regulatory factor